MGHFWHNLSIGKMIRVLAFSAWLPSPWAKMQRLAVKNTMETMGTTMDIMGKRLSSSVGPAESPMPRQKLMLMLMPILNPTTSTHMDLADIADIMGTPTTAF